MLTKNKVNHLLADGYNHLSVDRQDLSDTPAETAKGDEWYLTGTAHGKKHPRIMIPVFAIVCLLIIFFGISTYQNNARSFATIYLDVNPSIKVSINKNEQVLAVHALNEDAEKIIDGMDFKGSSLKVTVNALIGSLVRNGYINADNNSILVSIADTDSESGKHLEKELLEEISYLLDNGSVLSQQVNVDNKIKSLADEYGISLGKAQLIIELADTSGKYTYRELAGLTIHELNLLNKKTEEVSVNRNGEPSDQSYIGINEAIQAALDHAGIDQSKAFIDEAEIEYDGSRMVYEVEFRFDGYEYDYTVDAVSGSIVRHEKEKSKTDSFETSKPAVDGIIPSETAKQAALKHAGLTDSQIKNFKTELEYERGVLKYEMEFISGENEYDYEVDAKTGSILKYEKEIIDPDEQAEKHYDDDRKEKYDHDDHDEDDDYNDDEDDDDDDD